MMMTKYCQYVGLLSNNEVTIKQYSTALDSCLSWRFCLV